MWNCSGSFTMIQRRQPHQPSFSNAESSSRRFLKKFYTDLLFRIAPNGSGMNIHYWRHRAPMPPVMYIPSDVHDEVTYFNSTKDGRGYNLLYLNALYDLES